MIGSRISHYKILAKLGEGGMGVVYEAEDLKLNRAVALKFLPRDLTHDTVAKKRFVAEARAASALDHPNICNIHEIDETPEGLMFICMALYRGATLRQMIDRGPLEWKIAVDVATQVCNGLAKAHSKGIVHRDLKPANILMTEDERATIVDFGLAKLAGRTRITDEGATVGTVAYMAPEQACGDAIDQRADIWSLGVCLHEMLTGELPFAADFPQAVIYMIVNAEPKAVSTLRPEVPPVLGRIVEKALAKRLNERYQDADEFLSDLVSVTGGHKSGLETPGQKKRPSIAVLPFTNLSADEEQEYFCDGITEDIMGALTRAKELDVAARTSCFLFRDRHEDIREIGRRLKVETVLEGSVRKVGQRLRVSAQLVNVASGYHLWSEHYDHELKNVFAIQDEIALKIVQALEVQLSHNERRALEKLGTRDVEAYDFYLRGRKYFYQRRRQGIDFALQMFSQAIMSDSNYALAYAGIADCYSFSYMYFDRNRKNLDGALEASQRALELDAELAESHAARGLAVSLTGRHAEAAREFETAVGLNPKLFEAYYFYGRTCRLQGQLEKAARLFEKACLVSPEDYQAPILLGLTFKGLGDDVHRQAAYLQAIAIIEKRLQLNPDDSRAIYLGAAALIDLGDEKKSLEWIDRALAIDPTDPVMLYNTACVYSQAGKLENAIDYFENALAAGYANREWAEKDPDLEAIQEHPRFRALINKL